MAKNVEYRLYISYIDADGKEVVVLDTKQARAEHKDKPGYNTFRVKVGKGDETGPYGKRIPTIRNT